jgi:hypothetical protein
MRVTSGKIVPPPPAPAAPPAKAPARSEPRPQRAKSGSGMMFVLLLLALLGGGGLLVLACMGLIGVGTAMFLVGHQEPDRPPGPVAQAPKQIDKFKVERPDDKIPDADVVRDPDLGKGVGPDFDKIEKRGPDPFDDKGRVPVDKDPGPPPAPRLQFPPANVQPLKITPAPATFDKTSLKLPGTMTKVCLAGGGRFLIAAIPSQRQIAILDVSERKIVKYLPLAGDQPVIAAGLDKLVVAYPQQNTIQRWSLLNFQKELTVNSPFNNPIREMCMGHASFGPVLVAFQGGGFGGGGAMQLMALDTLKAVNLPDDPNRRGFGDGHFLHASANGRYFGMRDGVGGEPHTCTLLSLGDDSIKTKQEWGFGGSILAASPDGRFIYTSSGVYNGDLKKLHPQNPQGASGSYLPAAHGTYFIRLETGGGFGETPKAGKISFFVAGTYTPLAHLNNIEGVTTEFINYGSNRDSLTHSQRVHFIPNAKLVLVIPLTNDRIDLIRFDPEEAMEKSGIDYLVVTSDPPALAERGKRYTYSLVVKSKKGGVTVKLESGPPGMKMMGPRTLVWDVPADFIDRAPNIITTVSDAAGQELFHTFTVTVVDKLPAAAAPPREEVKLPVEPKKEEVVQEPEPKIKLPVVGARSLAIVAPKLAGKVVHDLGSPPSDVAVGGGGRFLLFGLPDAQKIALFDVNDAKIVHHFSMAGKDFRFSAGMSKLVVAYPDTRIIQRWDLLGREREISVNSPVSHDLHMVLMGSETEGPVFMGAGGYYSRGANGTSFLDLKTLKPIEWKEVGNRGFVTGNTRMSADGTVMTTTEQGLSPSGLNSFVRTGDKFQAYYDHTSPGIIVPGPDGKYLYTGYSGIYTNQLKPVGDRQGGTVIPSVQGDYYLRTDQNNLSICKAGESRPLLNLSEILKDLQRPNDGSRPKSKKGKEGVPGRFLSADKRLFFIPDANLFVALSPDSDQLYVYPLDIEAALDKQGIDYLFTTSRPPAAVQGEQFQYAIQVRSKKGGVRCKLEAGPDGMKVSPRGVVTWNVPADGTAEQTVLITIQDASGQEIFHNFKLTPTPAIQK